MAEPARTRRRPWREAPSDRARVRRIPERGSYDRGAADEILDSSWFCHVGFVQEGRPFVIPMLHARVDDTVYLHGSAASRLLGLGETEVCLAVTLVDGLVLARSAFHHSANYRSLVAFGLSREVPANEKETVLEAFSEKLLAGRWTDVRAPNEPELKATSALAVTLEEFSVKSRSGPPGDEEEDYELDVWAGVLPVEQRVLEPIPDPRLKPGVQLPPYLR
ncbi:MAG: pyridoxamine 5'-phosphate oxidase family protein [Actinobacteria bacterium]|nr:pyridoxamine 5'-phosphate oxidase family protein [Actinomycetota bacterium]